MDKSLILTTDKYELFQKNTNIVELFKNVIKMNNVK